MTSLSIAMPSAARRPTTSVVLIGMAFLGTALLMLFEGLVPWAETYPEAWVLRVDQALTKFVNWLINQADFGLFTFKEMTRGFGALLEAPMLFLKGLLVTGFKIEGEEGVLLQLPPLSWVGVIAICDTIRRSTTS